MNDFMKKKHHLRLIELEESVLIAQVKNDFAYIFVFFFRSINKVKKNELLNKQKQRKIHDIYIYFFSIIILLENDNDHFDRSDIISKLT